MSPEQRQIQELQMKVEKLELFMASFENAQTLAPNIALTIKKIAVPSRLADLTDVDIPSPTNGYVLKFTTDGVDRWIAAPDIDT